MRLSLSVLLLLAVASRSVYGSCPNACSHNGRCGEDDMCTCYPNFQGPDCSLRTCPYGISWITTAQGDLNYDGDTNDATVYSTDQVFTLSPEYVTTQATGSGGDWERWPSFFSSSDDEGHFYMECSNRGLCNRKTGQCECFDSYEGAACRRNSCPGACSGHGTCETVAKLASLSSFSYALWDADKSRACKCDPGYTGIDCSETFCPRGDDPLTTGQSNAKSFVRLFKSGNADVTHSIGGSVKLKYTDTYGEEWTTGDISVKSFKDMTTGEVSTLAASVKSELEGLPNNVLSAGVQVTVSRCSEAIVGTATVGGTGTTITFSDLTDAGDSYVCSDGEVFVTDGAGAITGGSPADVTTDTCFRELHYGQCVQIEVEFLTPGTHTLTVDSAGMTDNAGETTAQGATNLGNSVSTSLTVVSLDGTNVDYTHPDNIKKECAASDSCSITASTKTITLDADGASFEPGTTINVKCGSKSIGKYTVASSDATSVVVTEYIPDCAGTASNEPKLYSLSHYWKVASTTLTNYVQPGDRISTATWNRVSPEVLSVYQNSADTIIIFDGAYHTADETQDTDADISVYGVGTKEQNECSDRGLCDRSTGHCNCFKGYTGNDCSIQDVLKA